VSKPLPVRLALGLSWLALAIAVGASVRYYASGAALAFGDVALHLLGYAILAVLLLRAGARVATARMLLGLFIGWQLALAAFNLAFGSAQLPGLYSLDKLILGLQVLGALLLFAPASNAWFRGRA
jgi:hypothetical protein